jgi:hypothetical protein
MPVYLHPSNLIVLKSSIARKYSGGLHQFRLDFRFGEIIDNQEDDMLLCIAGWNAEDFNLKLLIENGLAGSETLDKNSDFTIYRRLSGLDWEVNWLGHDSVFAWHLRDNHQLIAKANHISSMAMDEVMRLQDAGVNPLMVIRC